MFGINFSKAHPQQKPAAATPVEVSFEDRITITRDPVSGEWVLEMSPGLDLMEVARVLGVIQSHAIELMQQQCSLGAAPAPVVDQSLTDTVEF